MAFKPMWVPCVPPSRGRIKLKSKDPFEHPSILFNYMSTEQDWQEFRGDPYYS
jgi:choline dehydrogenase-like flavoprotein